MLGIDYNLMRKSDILGKAFKFSVDYYGFDSKKLVRTIMTDNRLDYLFECDDCQDWCDGQFLMSIIAYEVKPVKGECADAYAMWFLGYLYKYWMKSRGIDRREIYKILPFERFMVNFDFYHTQGWDYVIDEAIRVYNSGDYVI